MADFLVKKSRNLNVAINLDDCESRVEKLSLIPLKYRVTWLIVSVLFSIPVFIFFSFGLASSSFGTAVFWGLILFVMWGAWWLLGRGSAVGYFSTMALCAIGCVPLIWQVMRRLRFMAQNGGMEPADGYGSPMAFLLGMVFELSLLLPMATVVVVGLLCLPGVLKSIRAR